MKSLCYYLLTISFLPGFLVLSAGCNSPGPATKTARQIDETFISELRVDSLIISFANINKQLDLGAVSDRYNLRHYDKKLVEKNRKNCHTPGQVIALYKKSGVTHAREYLSLNWRRILIVYQLQRKYPDLYKLPKSERREIFAAAVPKFSIVDQMDSLVSSRVQTH